MALFQYSIQWTLTGNSGTAAIPYDHVLLTFTFEQFVSLTDSVCVLSGVLELQTLLCMHIRLVSAILILTMATLVITPLAHSQNVQSSCDNLAFVTIPLQIYANCKTFCIVVSFEPQPAIDWVYVGEVEFFGTPTTPPPSNSTEPTISG